MSENLYRGERGDQRAFIEGRGGPESLYRGEGGQRIFIEGGGVGIRESL